MTPGHSASTQHGASNRDQRPTAWGSGLAADRRCRLALRWSVALIVGSAPSLGSAETIDRDERAQSVLIVVAPAGSAIGTSSFLFAAATEIEADTDLRLLSAEQAGIDQTQFAACERHVRFTCWARTARPDYDPAALVGADGEVLGFETHQRRLAERGGQGTAVLFVVVAQPTSDDHALLSLVVIELDDALSRFHARRERGDDWAAAVEDEIFATSVKSKRRRIDPGDDAALAALFRRIVQDDLRPLFERRRARRGAIRIASKAGLSIRLDGAPIGATAAAGTTITGLLPGRRRIELADDSADVFQAVIDVRPGEVTQVSAPLPPLVSAHPARAPILWGGVAVLVAGVAVGAVALAGGDRQLQARCVRRASEPDAPCDGAGFLGFGADAAATPTADPNAVDPSGVAMAPLAGALLITGASASLGAWLSDPEDVPWLPAVVGLALGALGYGVSVAIAGG